MFGRSKLETKSRQSKAERARPDSAGGAFGDASREWRRSIKANAPGGALTLDLDRDHLRGSDEASVTLIEYGDYASPACKAAARDVRTLRERFGPRLRVGFRHFPVTDAHPCALHAAEAAEAAGGQDRFWEMHDLIYGDNQHSWGRADELDPELLRGLAERLELDLDQFDSDIADETHRPHILEDFRAGAGGGVNGTPTFFINGERLDGDYDVDTLGQALERGAS